MFSAAFWTGAFDRAIKSFAQALLLMWGFDEGFNVLEINFVASLGVGAGAAVLSLLTSVISAPVGERGTTSMLSGGH
jgi:hypothetical protein